MVKKSVPHIALGFMIIFHSITSVYAMDPKDFFKYEQRAKRYMVLAKACEEGDEKTALRLLNEGVEPNGNYFRDVVYHLNEGYRATLIDAPIVFAARNGDFRLVKALLQKDADPNLCCCTCITSLHEAILGKHVKVVELLLENGADVTIKYDLEMTALELAKKVGNQKIIEMIQRYLDKNSP